MQQITNEQQTQQISEEYPVDIIVEYPENPSRGLAVATLFFLIPKLIILLPHIILLYFVGIFGFICAIFAQFAVLFKKRYPKSLFDFVIGTYRWQTRMNAYLLGLTDKYPPFRFKK